MSKHTRSAKWFSRVEQQQASGLSQSAWCAKEGVALSTFQYWVRKHRLQPTRPAFIELPAPAVNIAAGLMDLTFPSGHQLTFHGPVPASFIRELLS